MSLRLQGHGCNSGHGANRRGDQWNKEGQDTAAHATVRRAPPPMVRTTHAARQAVAGHAPPTVHSSSESRHRETEAAGEGHICKNHKDRLLNDAGVVARCWQHQGPASFASHPAHGNRGQHGLATATAAAGSSGGSASGSCSSSGAVGVATIAGGRRDGRM